jgi:hydrogenase large subunit
MKVETVVDGGQVKEAAVSGTLFRGFEIFLRGRHPVDAQRLTQRVCGVCPTVHSTAAAFNLDQAFNLVAAVPHNGRITRNLILGSNYLQSHILHFYALCALDFVDVAAAADYAGDDPDLLSVRRFIDRGQLAPFFPRYEGDYRLSKEENVRLLKHYVQALRTRALCHEMLAIYGGKMPHNVGIVPGGVTQPPTTDNITRFLWKVNTVREFVENAYVPDVLTVARAYPDYAGIGAGPGNFLVWGVFDQDSHADYRQRQRFFPSGAWIGGSLQDINPDLVTEDVARSWYTDDCAGKPSQAKTAVAPDKAGAYSWLKSPRYAGVACEVGPAARAWIAYRRGVNPYKAALDGALGELKASPEALNSVLGRHLSRAVEAKLLCAEMARWVGTLRPDEPCCAGYQVPQSAVGMGLVDGPRGALGHWIEIKDYKIERYQLVVPTTWNAGPRDGRGAPGPIEQALIGAKVKDAENPFEIVRIIRSFDPCLACSVHVLTARRNEVGVFEVV